MDKFNLKYNSKSLEPYYYSLKLLDMITQAVFANNSEDVQRYTKKDVHNDFINKVDNYLNFTGCNITARELLFLVDLAFYNRIDQQMSRAFKEKPPYFYKIFDELHGNILPIIFDINSSREQINYINNCLIKYREVINLSFQMLGSLENSNSYKDFFTFMRIYQQKLAKRFKELDTKAYFEGPFSNNELLVVIRDSAIDVFEDTSTIYLQNQNFSSQNKKIQ